MNSITSAVKRHPLVTFFALAYGISYGFYALSATLPDFPFLFPFGSVIAAIIVASLTDGMAGLKDLLSRCLRWRVGLRWYAAALLVPVAIALTTIGLNILLGAPLPGAATLGPWYSIFLLFPMAMIDAPLQENSGWHGYAMPRFQASRSPLANTLILGVLLAGWHAPLALAEPSLTLPYLITTILSQVVTNWVFYNARQSALLAILYHTAANTMGLYFAPALAGAELTRYFWVLAASMLWQRSAWCCLTGKRGNQQAQPQRRIISRRIPLHPNRCRAAPAPDHSRRRAERCRSRAPHPAGDAGGVPPLRTRPQRLHYLCIRPTNVKTIHTQPPTFDRYGAARNVLHFI
ncbi:MAG TPA: CPBP family intramembrane glutamic endopeptidase [Roseiflexaceae bacterium]|nr:CPBP family intramembrane glutamic endopeptidase [Roseiflexaceae bacterium]